MFFSPDSAVSQIAAIIIFHDLSHSSSFSGSLSIELVIETTKLKRGEEGILRDKFDHSIKNWFAPFLLTITLIVPLDILSEIYFYKPFYIFRIMIFAGLFFLLFKFSNILSDKIFYKFELQKKPNLTTSVTRILLPVISTIFIQIWEQNIINRFISGQISEVTLLLLFISGILPLRIIDIFVPGRAVYERLFTLLTIVIYVSFRMKVFSFF